MSTPLDLQDPKLTGNPERTQILVSLIRSSLVPIAKLELSTAEQTAYIDKPKMRILREIYKVAKEDERRRMLGEGETTALWQGFQS